MVNTQWKISLAFTEKVMVLSFIQQKDTRK